MTAIVAAIMMVRNERHILAASIGHLLNGVGSDLVMVADNGSTDGTRTVLKRLASADSRVRWTDASGPYAQAEIITGLAREAHRAGGDTWVLPIDADEFLWLPTSAMAMLKDDRVFGGWSVSVRNFVQWRWVRSDSLTAITKMIFSAPTLCSELEAREQVEAGSIAFVQAAYPQKLILRTCSELVIHKGSHSAVGMAGPVKNLERAQILHAQLRARDVLDARVEKAKRLPVILDAGTSWHLRRLGRVDLDAEWKANSTRFGEVGFPGRRSRLRFDLRLRQCALRQMSFATRITCKL